MWAGTRPAPTVGGVVAGFIPAWRGVVSLRGVKESLPSRFTMPKQSLWRGNGIAAHLSGARNDNKNEGLAITGSGEK